MTTPIGTTTNPIDLKTLEAWQNQKDGSAILLSLMRDKATPELTFRIKDQDVTFQKKDLARALEGVSVKHNISVQLKGARSSKSNEDSQEIVNKEFNDLVIQTLKQQSVEVQHDGSREFKMYKDPNTNKELTVSLDNKGREVFKGADGNVVYTAKTDHDKERNSDVVTYYKGTSKDVAFIAEYDGKNKKPTYYLDKKHQNANQPLEKDPLDISGLHFDPQTAFNNNVHTITRQIKATGVDINSYFGAVDKGTFVPLENAVVKIKYTMEGAAHPKPETNPKPVENLTPTIIFFTTSKGYLDALEKGNAKDLLSNPQAAAVAAVEGRYAFNNQQKDVGTGLDPQNLSLKLSKQDLNRITAVITANMQADGAVPNAVAVARKTQEFIKSVETEANKSGGGYELAFNQKLRELKEKYYENLEGGKIPEKYQVPEDKNMQRDGVYIQNGATNAYDRDSTLQPVGIPAKGNINANTPGDKLEKLRQNNGGKGADLQPLDYPSETNNTKKAALNNGDLGQLARVGTPPQLNPFGGNKGAGIIS